MLTLETCGDFLFLETFFAVRITGKSKQHFHGCSIILNFNVEGKKLTNLYRYIYIINYNARVRLLSYLFATLSFMLYVEQSSGNCHKKRLQSKIFENTEQ